jgi:hypothetical protein
MVVETNVLSKFSTQLLTQLNKIDVNIDVEQLHILNNPYLDEIYTKMDTTYKEAEGYFSSLKAKQMFPEIPTFSVIDNDKTRELPLTEPRIQISEHFYSKFTAPSIQSILQNKIVYCSGYELVICGVSVKLQFYALKKWTSKTSTFLRIMRIIKRIIFVIYFFRDNTCNTKEILDMDIFLIDIKKKFPSKRMVKLDVENVNSGFTSFMSDGVKHIITFRDEEKDKIVVHELIHFFYLDFHSLNCDLSKMVNVKPTLEFIPNESYTELMTIIFHTALISIESSGNLSNASIILQTELFFGYFQCAKLLFHYGYSHVDEFFTPYNGTTDAFYQNSCVISYYFIKTALLSRFDLTMEFLKDRMNNYKIDCSDHTKDSYKTLFMKCLNDPIFKQNVQQYLHYINTYVLSDCDGDCNGKNSSTNSSTKKRKQLSKKNSKKKSFSKGFKNTSIFKTLRMSIVEL